MQGDYDKSPSTCEKEEKASLLIQTVYRGYRTRKRLREESSTDSFGGENMPLDKIQKSSWEQEDVSMNSDDQLFESPEKKVGDYATIIQAHVRGYLTRKHLKAMKNAAIKIQNAFREYMCRKYTKQENPLKPCDSN